MFIIFFPLGSGFCFSQTPKLLYLVIQKFIGCKEDAQELVVPSLILIHRQLHDFIQSKATMKEVFSGISTLVEDCPPCKFLDLDSDQILFDIN